VGENACVTEHRTLVTSDGVDIHALHVPRPAANRDVCLVVVHGFTGSSGQVRVRKVIDRLRAFGGVIAIDLRGHGRSAGRTTVGDEEIHDVHAAVRWARELGYRRVVLVGFSLGGAVVLRAAALPEDAQAAADAVVSVSAPAFWYYRGTRVMRGLHWLVETRPGRAMLRARGTRVSDRGWPDPRPLAPHEAAGRLPVPLLVVHGDVDRYFPMEHPRAIHRAAAAAGVRADLWEIEGLGHAESAVTAELLDRIGVWARESQAAPAGSEVT
jgi:pimeloyl-ACP methyl ester carboxylesterase